MSEARTAGGLAIQPAWRIDRAPQPYEAALGWMEAYAARVADGRAGDLVWLTEHPSTYTAGTSTKPGDVLDPALRPLVTGRGGRVTWHGPGQRMGYVIRDLRPGGLDLRRHVCRLEAWVIAAVARLGVTARRIEGRPGVWVEAGPNGRPAKLAALGVRVRRGVAFHGIALNIAPDLAAFARIVPCGLADADVTSLAAQGVEAAPVAVDDTFRAAWAEVWPAHAASPMLAA